MYTIVIYITVKEYSTIANFKIPEILFKTL